MADKRPVMRTLASEELAVEKFTGRMHRAMMATFERDLQNFTMLVLLAVAYYLDITEAAGETTSRAYPSDIAMLLGLSDARAVNELSRLKRLSFLNGSAAGGYTLAAR